MRQIPHLNELQAKFQERGLVVVGVTGEAAERVDPFIKEHDVHYPMAIGYGNDYQVRGIPHCFLIDKDGKIAWRGHPASLDERSLDALLVGAKPATVCKGLEEVHQLRANHQLGAAYRLTAKLLEHGELSAAAQQQAKDWNEAATTFVQTTMAEADAAEKDKDVYLLWSKLDVLAREYDGMPGAESAKQRLDKLMTSKQNQQEVEAGQRLDEAERLIAALDYDGGMAIYDELGRSRGRTKAGKDAKVRYRDLLKAGMLGFDAKCNYCQAGGCACPTHRRKK